MRDSSEESEPLRRGSLAKAAQSFAKRLTGYSWPSTRKQQQDIGDLPASKRAAITRTVSDTLRQKETPVPHKPTLSVVEPPVRPDVPQARPHRHPGSGPPVKPHVTQSAVQPVTRKDTARAQATPLVPVRLSQARQAAAETQEQQPVGDSGNTPAATVERAAPAAGQHAAEDVTLPGEEGAGSPRAATAGATTQAGGTSPAPSPSPQPKRHTWSEKSTLVLLDSVERYYATRHDATRHDLWVQISTDHPELPGDNRALRDRFENIVKAVHRRFSDCRDSSFTRKVRDRAVEVCGKLGRLPANHPPFYASPDGRGTGGQGGSLAGIPGHAPPGVHLPPQSPAAANDCDAGPAPAPSATRTPPVPGDTTAGPS